MQGKILNREQLKKWDESVVINRGISLLELMETAGSKCTEWILQHFTNDCDFHIFCGKGNNGGDGLVIARLLKEKNYSVQVYLIEENENASECFTKNLQRLENSGIRIHFISIEPSNTSISKKSIIIDALFGSGLNRPVTGLAAAVINYINGLNAIVISVDVPSGMYIDESSKGNAVIRAAYTLTFQILKLCFLAAENASSFGKVEILDIGLNEEYPAKVDSLFYFTRINEVAGIYKKRTSFSHKGTYGHSLLIAGSKGKTGAAILSARACLRSGTGLLTCCIPETAFPVLNMAAPEAMAISQTGSNVYKNFNSYNSIGIGPGLNTNTDSEKMLRRVLNEYKLPMVIDADALNIISKNKKWLHHLPAHSILTPHPKEFERLFGKSENDFERIHKALTISSDLNLIIVLKNHHTLVAFEGKGYFNSTGNAGMATGGSGDVLTGIITALLSQGYSPKEAAQMGVFIHGLAGELSLGDQSMESMLPTDIIEHLGKAFLQIAKTPL
ncbi:MAG: epimerase [Chitinophagaceae bacterium]|nr:epimerase [Chitinophagaceae bacterium]